MTVLAIIGFTTAIVLALDNMLIRRKLRGELKYRADLALRALGDGMVLVDGHTLPDPEDPRWATNSVFLFVGDVCVQEDGAVFVRDLNVDAFPLYRTAAMAKYAADVWCAYRNRRVRKSLEAS